MKNQAVFSLKDKSKKLKCRLRQFLFGPLRLISRFLFSCCGTAFLIAMKYTWETFIPEY